MFVLDYAGLIMINLKIPDHAASEISTAEDIDKGIYPNPIGPKSKLKKYRELGIFFAGLKKCLDPSATPLQKALYYSRPIVVGLTFRVYCRNFKPYFLST